MAIFTRDRVEQPTAVNGAAAPPVEPPTAVNGAPAPAPPAVDPLAPACEHCGAQVAPEQDWCLECGAARRPGVAERWRLPVAIVTAVVLIAGAATALAFMGLSDSSHHQVAAVKAPAPGPTPPVTATPPSAAPPTAAAPPASATPSGKPPKAPKVTGPAAPVKPVKPVKPPKVKHDRVPASPDNNPVAPAPAQSPDARGKLRKLPLEPNTIRVFDPYGDGNEHPELAPKAVDGDPGTFWKTRDYPDTTLSKKGVGLIVQTADTTAPTTLKLTTQTPGWGLEIYGAKDGPPPRLPATGWVKLGSSDSVGATARLPLELQGDRYKYYLVWITALAPQNTNAAINEIQLLAPGR